VDSHADRAQARRRLSALAALRERLAFEVRTRLDALPSIFARQTGLRGHRDLAVRASTAIVIEGFPRSGNTWAVASFLDAQGISPWDATRDFHVARHLHAPAQVLLARRFGVPALVVVRPLPDPVLSLLVRHPALTAAQALRAYARFHEALLPVRDGCVRAAFEEVTADMAAVIRRVNARFGTAFAEGCPGKEADARVRSVVAEMERRDAGGGPVRDTHVSLPSATRERLKQARRAEYDAPALEALRVRAATAATALLG